MTISKETLLRNIVKEIRRGYELTYPLDVKDFIAKMNGKVEQTTFEDSTINFKVISTRDSFVVKIPKEDNFLLAKAIGALILHLHFPWIDGEKELTDSPLYRQSYFEEDYQSNLFARELLMPEDDLLEYYHKGLTMKEIADLFNVTIDQLKFRYGEYGLPGGLY